MVSEELLNSANLSGAQALYVHEPTKVVVVGQHKGFVLTGFEIVTPGLKGFNNG